ncbi:MAG: thiamine phosphate synthase, partial [Novosphingobium sp.]
IRARTSSSALSGAAGSGIARCYSAAMRARQPPGRTGHALPRLWLVTDARNDAVLDRAIARLPRGAGVIFRHHHLPRPERRRRFEAIRRACRRRSHRLVLAAPPALARRWRADGSYAAPAPGVTLATVHGLRAIGRANRMGAVAAILSPVFATRSHPGAAGLGRVRFLLLARHSCVPVIALGGMTARRFRGLKSYGWAAIDGLSPAPRRARPQDS